MEIEMNIKKCKSTQTKVMRVTLNFDKLIKKLQEIEKDRGNINCSETTATEILCKKIENAGGLKDK